MYIAGFVIPVPEANRAAYLEWAKMSAALFKEYGCLEIVEAWEDNVPTGEQTDLRRAVKAREGECIVFTWQIWPDKVTLDAVEQAMQSDPRFDPPGELCFDPSRIIYGTFKPFHVMGRD